METRSVSPPSVSKGADTSSELPAGTKEGSPNVPVSGSVPLSEDSLQEIPEKKQKAAKVTRLFFFFSQKQKVRFFLFLV